MIILFTSDFARFQVFICTTYSINIHDIIKHRFTEGVSMILIMGKLLDFALSESLSITKNKVKEIVKEKKIKKDLLNNIRNTLVFD